MNNYAVAWVPESSETPETQEEALGLGGRIIDSELPFNYATKVRSCLTIGAPSDGHYVVVQ